MSSSLNSTPKFQDIVNSMLEKIVRKILRSLHEKFYPKITIIGESKNIDTAKVEELVGSLQNFELRLKPIKKSSFEGR